MHPIIITALYPPAVGGAATYFGDIVPRLAQSERVEQLTILTERMPGQPRQSTAGNIQFLRYLPTRNSLGQRPWLIHAATYMLTQFWFATYLPDLVQKHQIDLIHFHTRYRGRLFYNALQRSGVPIVADLRDKMTNSVLLVDVTDWLLCCGAGVQQFAVELGFPSERTSLVPIPFQPPKIPSPEQTVDIRQRFDLGANPFLLFVGDITYNKGIYDLLEAFQHWQIKHPDVQLIIAGPNREGKRFLDQVQKIMGVVYLDKVPHPQVLALMRGAEIVILPSRSEGLPRVILEAVALETKVICPPGIPEFKRHLSQFTLPQVTSQAIAKALEITWQNPSNPTYPFTKHRIEQITEHILDLYQDVIIS